MIVEKLQVVNFKNIPQATLEFSPGVNCLVGRNGMGKSNLLEAIHYLSFVRGFRTLPDRSYIRHGAEMMLLKGDYLRDDGTRDTLSVGMGIGKRKVLKSNGKEYSRLADHIGRYPVVVSTPGDTNLISGSGEFRRRLLDMVISQADGVYLANLVRYNKALEGRNRMLRGGVSDPLLYESVEKTLADAARHIHAVRKRYAEETAAHFAKSYGEIAVGAECAGLKYRSRLSDASPEDILDATRSRDVAVGFTTAGIHRDDLEITINGYSARNLGSQGQIKSLTVALKIAVYDFLRKATGQTPVLLLDDIFDKLDATRVEAIMRTVNSSEAYGQIFITDTNRQHLDRIIANMPGSLMIEVADGQFTPRP